MSRERKWLLVIAALILVVAAAAVFVPYADGFHLTPVP
jgi:hypothetical protein